MSGLRLLVAVLAAVLVAGCYSRRARAPEAPRVVDAPAPVLEAESRKPSQEELEARIPEDHRLTIGLARKRVKGLQWEDMSLSSAVMYLRTITGLNYHVTPKVMEEKHEDIVISLALDDVGVNTVLDLITQPQGLRWEVRDGVVWILTTEEVDGPLRLRYYDIKDLIRPVGEHGYASEDDAVTELQRNVFPKYWKREGVSLEGRKGILIGRASWAVHDALTRELEDERGRLEQPGLPDVLKQKLGATKVSLSIDKMPLGDVLKTLRIQTGLNLMIDPRVAYDINDVQIVALKVKDVSILTVLNMLATQAGENTVWVGKGDVAVLTLPEFAN